MTASRERSSWRERLSLWRSLFVFTPLYFFATAGYGTVSMMCSWFDARGRRQHRVAQAWARMLLRIAGIKVQVEGSENLPLGAPCVMVCNHLSYMDVPCLFAHLPLQFRILARKGLFKIPFLGGHLRRCQHLEVDQSNVMASMRSVYRAAESVHEGLPVFVFPEAGRSFDGKLHDFMPGAFLLAVKAQVPLVPMVLDGTYELLRPATAHLRPGVVHLLILPPISTEGMGREDVPKLTQRVHDAMGTIYAARHPESATVSS